MSVTTHLHLPLPDSMLSPLCVRERGTAPGSTVIHLRYLMRSYQAKRFASVWGAVSWDAPRPRPVHDVPAPGSQPRLHEPSGGCTVV